MKRLIAAISLIIILCVGVYAVVYMQREIPITYDGRGTDVYELQQNPQDYDTSDPDGVAAIMVEENLATFAGFTPLEPEETELLARAAAELRRRTNNGCTGCEYCMPCPAGVDIPENFSLWNRLPLQWAGLNPFRNPLSGTTKFLSHGFFSFPSFPPIKKSPKKQDLLSGHRFTTYRGCVIWMEFL